MKIKQLFKTNEQPIIINRLGNNNYIYTYVIETGNGVVKNYGYPLKNKDGYQGVLVTSVLETKDGKVVSTSVTFVPGKFTVKAKKGHGTICTAKTKKDKASEETENGED